MASTNLEIVISATDRFTGTASKVVGSLNSIHAAAGRVGTGMGQLGVGLARIGVAAAATAATAIGAAAKIGVTFQQQMELIHTQAGALQQEVIDQTAAVKNLVHEVGTSPIELAKGLYHIESVGVRGAAALDILKASALGAKTGLADMETVSNALTAVWYSGIQGAKDMTQAMSILDVIVGVGNMRLQDLVDSFGTGILGTAKTFGVGIRELGATLAVLTDAGVPAVNAATRLSMTFTHLAAPTAAALKVFKKLGIDQFQFAKDLRSPDGVFKAFQDLHNILLKNGEIVNGTLTPQGTADVTKMFGGSRFGATAMQLLDQYQRIGQKYDMIMQQQDTFGEKVARTMDTAGFKFGQFRADIENAALAFSDGFLPALARAGSKLDTFLVGHMGDIKKLGADLGTAIDGIDWKKVQDGAQTFVDIAKMGLGILQKIPPEVIAIGAAFMGLNRISGGLLGTGLGNIAGGVTGLLARGAGSLIGGKAGGIIGSIGAQPVFVTNWPLGGLGVGGGGLASEGAGLLSIVRFGIIAAIPAIIAANLLDKHTAPDKPLTLGSFGLHPDSMSGGLGVGAGGGLARGLGGGLGNPLLDRGGRELGGFSTGLAGAFQRLAAAVKTVSHGIEVEAARMKLHWSLQPTGAQIRSFRDGSLTKGDVAQGDNLVTFYRTTVHPSVKSIERDLGAMHRLYAHFVAVGDTKTATHVAGQIKALEKVMADTRARLDKLNQTQHETVAAIKDKDLSVNVTIPVTTNVSIRDFHMQQRTLANIQSSSAGPGK